MKSIGSASSVCEANPQSRTLGGFGGHAPLSTDTSECLSMAFLHSNTPSVKLVVWAYLVLPETMENSIISGRDSWTIFNPQTHIKLSQPHESGRILGETTLRLHNNSGAQAFVMSTTE